MTVVNALTIDVEDYFQVHAFSNVICFEDWDGCTPTVERNTHRLLDLLDSVEGPKAESSGGQVANYNLDENISTVHAASCQLPAAPCPPRATFFILGWIAERYPALVKEIQKRGHEVACHGYTHQCIYNQKEKEFKEDVRRAKEILENLIGTQIIGYRAPTCSITRDTLWALEILCELGFLYDSSIFPVRHDFYGFPEAPRFPFCIDFTNGDLLSQLKNPKYLHELKGDGTTHNEEALISMPHVHPACPVEPSICSTGVKFAKGDHFTGAPCPMPDALRPGSCALSPKPELFIEFPLSTIRLLGQKLPCSGGGYFRLFPYWYTRRGFKKLNNNGTQPVIFYIHPWELDPEIPVVDQASRRSKFRTYVNLNRTESRFKRLLQEFHFAPLASILNAYR